MALFTQICTPGITPPYTGIVGRQPVTKQTFSNIRTADGDTGAIDSSIIVCGAYQNPLYYSLYRQAFAFDLTALNDLGMTVTAAALHIRSDTHEDDFATQWSDTNRGAILVAMDESMKTANTFNTNEYQAITASFTELGNAVPFSSIAPALSWTTFTFNSTGIAYFNTVRSKANFPGYAHFAIAFTGDARNIAPSPFPDEFDLQKIAFYGSFSEEFEHLSPYLELTYSSSIRVNIGDAWKSVESIQVNIGNVWKDVDSIKANVGDAWKDLV